MILIIFLEPGYSDATTAAPRLGLMPEMPKRGRRPQHQKRTSASLGRAALIKAARSLDIAHFGQPDTSIAVEHTRLRPEPMDCWIDFAAGRPGHCNFETWNP